MKYKCKVLERIGNNQYREIKEIKFKPEEHEILEFKEQKKTIPLLSEMYSFEIKGVTYILWNHTDNEILKLNKIPIPINAKFLDKFLTTTKVGIIGQLLNAVHLATSGGSDKWSKLTPFMWLIIGGVMGFLAGGGMS